MDDMTEILQQRANANLQHAFELAVDVIRAQDSLINDLKNRYNHHMHSYVKNQNIASFLQILCDHYKSNNATSIRIQDLELFLDRVAQ